MLKKDVLKVIDDIKVLYKDGDPMPDPGIDGSGIDRYADFVAYIALTRVRDAIDALSD